MSKNRSRTYSGFKNIKVALFFYIINLLLNFISRRFFIEYLGIELLGLNTTVTNLLGFLNIAELGIGSAVSYALYKPLFERNKQTINEIVSVQGWLYRKIALIVILGALILMFFFPIFFAKVELPFWYIYGSFIVMLISSLLGYFVNYRQIVLVADQKEYKVSYNVQGGKAIKVILQIIAITNFEHGYLYWLIIEVIASFVIAIALNETLKKEYSWLKTSSSDGKFLKDVHPEIIKKTKQLFFHRISAFAASQCTPLIIYAYTSLTLVAIYGNYMVIIGGITLFVNALFNSLGAGVGNLVAEGNMNNIKSFYWECVSSRYWLVSILCFALLLLSHSFVALWVGKEYILPQSSFILLLIYTFIVCTRISDLFIAAYGMYQDVWAPIVETIINIGGSVILGYHYGLTGVIGGSILSLFAIVFCWKPYFLFRLGFKSSVKDYIFSICKYLILISLSFILSIIALKSVPRKEDYSLFYFGIKALVCLLVYTSISLILFTSFDVSFRRFGFRIIYLVRKKK